MPERNRNRPFQVMFILQNAPKESWQLPGLSVDWSPLDTGTSKLDLIVFLKIEPRLEISLEYSKRLFAPTTMNKLLADYQAILEVMVKDPNERVDNIQNLSK
jgi:non-ribosomal peptide synthetase component F